METGLTPIRIYDTLRVIIKRTAPGRNSIANNRKDCKPMIELPETTVLADQIRKNLIGKQITNVQANTHPHKFAWYTGDPGNYPAMLTGKKITGSAAGAGSGCGYSTMILCEDTLLELGTPIRYYPKGSRLPAKHQLLLTFDDDSFISCTVKMWGALFCIPATAFPDDKKPSPLTDAFDERYFEQLCSASPKNLSLKALLATEQRIPGLGNGVLQDILWNAALHPKRSLLSLNDKEQLRLYQSIKETLKAMAEQGGRDTEKDLFGKAGGYPTVCSNTALSRPCPRCGGKLIRQSYLGGAIYFCPVCQPEPYKK